MTAKAPAGAPPVLWVVVWISDRNGSVMTYVCRDKNTALDTVRQWDRELPHTAPHRVVAYVPRDTPC